METLVTNTGRGLALVGGYDRLGQLAQSAEAAGFDAVWVSETTANSTVQAAVVATATERIDVGTNVTLAFPRSPTVAAMEAWDLNLLTGHRFVLGLGTQIRRIVEERFSAAFDRPAARMEDYLQALRTVWRMERGEAVVHDGEFYRVLRPGLGGPGDQTGRRLPRVYVAAVGPLMTQVAARRADGLIGHPFTSVEYVRDHVVPRVEEILDREGRAARDFTLCQGLTVCIAEDRDVARHEARQQIGFYGSTPNYAGVFDSCGDGALGERLRQLWRRGRPSLPALVAAVPDEAVDRYAIAGSPDEVKGRLDQMATHVDHVILSGAWYGVDSGRAAENLDAIVETFGTEASSGSAT